ncbi:MAG TPA: preprotein translocase subunit SecE [Thermoanaerobacterales bacterium]|nr:preprotein translocase subunit SecE [Thermoanaerobacterales bacterium]
MSATKKEGFIKRISRFFREVRSEMRKVIWPSRKELVNYTGVVIVSVIVVSVIIWVLDTFFSGVIGLIIR